MNLLKGKKGIIFGALDNKSIAWKIAEKAHEEGAVFTLSNTMSAQRFGQIDELAEKTKTGQTLWMKLHLSPRVDENGKVVWTWHDAKRSGSVNGVIVLE